MKIWAENESIRDKQNEEKFRIPEQESSINLITETDGKDVKERALCEHVCYKKNCGQMGKKL